MKLLPHLLSGILLANCYFATGSATAAEPARAWTIETVAGNGESGDLPAATSRAVEVPVAMPFGVECGPDGALYITSIGQHRVLRLDTRRGELSSVAGSGKLGYSGDGGPATEAALNEPYEVRFDDSGHYMYFVEMMNHLIRRVDLHTGRISTVAGAPEAGFAGDGGSASEARFRQPHSIALDDRGNLYVADIGNHRIRAIDLAAGTIRTIAGTGEKKLPRDGGPAAGQPILGPRALHVVGRTMWIALREGNSIWRLDLDTGVIRHVAGSGQSGYSGDGGPLLAATFNGPKGIAATAEGAVYVVDAENQAVRKIDTKACTIETIAGRGPRERGFAVEKGPALEAKVDRPHGIGIAPDGSLYLGDTSNHRVRWLRPQ
jgi:DNA-binding beta-propeller fold protein YncE